MPSLDEVEPGHMVACYNTVDYSWMDDGQDA